MPVIPFVCCRHPLLTSLAELVFFRQQHLEKPVRLSDDSVDSIDVWLSDDSVDTIDVRLSNNNDDETDDIRLSNNNVDTFDFWLFDDSGDIDRLRRLADAGRKWASGNGEGSDEERIRKRSRGFGNRTSEVSPVLLNFGHLFAFKNYFKKYSKFNFYSNQMEAPNLFNWLLNCPSRNMLQLSKIKIKINK